MSSWHALHFNKIAKVIRDKREQVEKEYVQGAWKNGKLQLLNDLTLEFAEYFRDQNPSFDANKFIAACGYKPEVI